MAEWKGVHYSDHDMLNMQQEAIRRVRQMQQRARQSINGGGDPPAGAALPPGGSMPDGATPAGGQGSALGQPSGMERPPGGKGPALHNGEGAAQNLQPLPRERAQPSLLDQIGSSLGLKGPSGGRREGGLGGLLTSVIGEDSPAARALSALGIDNERLLLIGLLLVLMNEKADRTLIIALVYLLL